MFAFYFWSAEAENSNKKISGYRLLEYSTAYFFLLDYRKSWTPITAGAVASIFVLCTHSTSCLFNLRAQHPCELIP